MKGESSHSKSARIRRSLLRKWEQDLQKPPALTLRSSFTSLFTMNLNTPLEGQDRSLIGDLGRQSFRLLNPIGDHL
jgi:hypothetical protein